MSEPVTIPSRQSSAPTDPAVVGGSRAHVDGAVSSREPRASGSRELELSDDDFVLLESSRPAPIPRAVLRAALAAAAAPASRGGASDGPYETRPRTRSDAAPDTRPTGGLGTPVPHLPLERDDASSSWDEESEVTDECLTAIAAEAARASRASDPFLLVTPRARKSPPHLREQAAAASARPARLPPPSAAASAPRASRPSFSRVPPCLPPHVAAPLDATDPDEADTLPVPVRAPAVAAKTSTPAPLRPFARTTADPVSPPLATPRVALPRPPSTSAGSGSMTPVALHTTSDRSHCFFQNRPRAVWLLASAAAGALGAVVGMQVLGPSLRASPAVSRAIVTSAEAPAPARADADGSAPVDESEAVEIGPPLPPAGPPPPPRRPATGSARPQPRPGGGHTARSPRQPRASAPASAAKKRTIEQAWFDAQLRAPTR